MASTLSAAHALSSAAGLLQHSKPVSTSSRRTTTSVPVVLVKAKDQAAVSRRQVAVSLTALSVALFASSPLPADARGGDIPLFGKKAKKLTDQVVQEVKELVKEGEGEVAAVGGAISGAVSGFPGAAARNIPSGGGGEGLSPALQAGAVAGAGVVGVLVASTVVNALVSPAAK